MRSVLAVALPTHGTSGFGAHCVLLSHGQMEGKCRKI
jgi:hypothetical protein